MNSLMEGQSHVASSAEAAGAATSPNRSDTVSSNQGPSLADLAHVESVTDERLRGWVHKDAADLLEGGLRVSIDGTPFANIAPQGLKAVPGAARYADKMIFELRLPRVPDTAPRRLIDVAFAANGQALPNSSRHPLPLRRPAKALVMIPAGARYEHDKIKLHRWPVERVIDTYSNIGDLMVYDSTLKLLSFEDVEVANIIDFTDKDVDRYNAEFDFVFLRGSNFIHEFMQWERAGELIARLKIPVYAIGVGAQAESNRRIDLPPEALRVWSGIADHCAQIGVRGAFSAQVLAENGIKNVEVVGCPSMFRARNEKLKLNVKDAYDIRKIAFSLRRETGKGYARNIEDYLRIQRDFMLRLDKESNLTVTLHGEREEKAFFFRHPERIEAAVNTLRGNGWLTSQNEAQILKIYENQLFFNRSVEQYDEFIRTMDLAIGYRVHGILPAMASGVPGVLVDYDERSKELAETHCIPLISEDDVAKLSWRDIYKPELFDKFQKAFPQRYRTMREFLNRNSVPHRL
ncbi:Polysaccharide pyruvyl transferase [Chelatococcus asaccharovorans]|uniref:Polysaccharide pyruvyl transferase n=2 Tax=Chelatococcus asaccharovorans TaxID=28210 RepID=A0A2V3TU57_9HYPH|nr:polysaccharide pyruvyl transferase [Chelatococcus asaccharovorans]CAH1651280.1 Polysaccharide pyruvyl transferase [Chelatococcus asaccharovorans]CAH1686643.1 Polysaccharide pyruvyl transferase [Chelatococcus asaccharovorans]